MSDLLFLGEYSRSFFFFNPPLEESLVSSVIFGIKKLLSKYGIDPKKSPFSFGFLLNSNVLINLEFKEGLTVLNNSDPSFFEPSVFTNKIPNYVTNRICENVGIKGFSISLINGNFYSAIEDFKNSTVDFCIFVDFSKKFLKKIKIFFFSKKEFTFLFKDCIMDGKGVGTLEDFFDSYFFSRDSFLPTKRFWR